MSFIIIIWYIGNNLPLIYFLKYSLQEINYLVEIKSSV